MICTMWLRMINWAIWKQTINVPWHIGKKHSPRTNTNATWKPLQELSLVVHLASPLAFQVMVGVIQWHMFIWFPELGKSNKHVFVEMQGGLLEINATEKLHWQKQPSSTKPNPFFRPPKKPKGSLVSGGCSTPPLPLASPGNNLQIAGDQPLRPFLVPLEKEDETKVHLAHVFWLVIYIYTDQWPPTRGMVP